MEQNTNLTLFQRLSTAFGLGTPKAPDQVTRYQYQYNSPIQNREIIVKTDNKQEFEREKLERQQQAYLVSQWSKTDSELYRQAIYYETTRLASYYDFEAMEFTPEISAALDIFMEESTTANDKGQILGVYSDSKRVKKVLEDLFYNILDINTNLPPWTRNTPIREDSLIPLLDGRIITIKDLSEEVKSGAEVWTYSVQDKTHAIVPGKIIWCDLTRKDSKLVRVTLDDDTYLDTTADHEYMLRNGNYKRADQLQPGDSLMPFYTHISTEKQNKISGYEKIYNPQTETYQYTHRIVAKECIINVEHEKLTSDKFLTHHKNLRKLNNDPKNLERLTFAEHAILHEKNTQFLKDYRNRPDVVKKRMAGIDLYLRSDERRQRLSSEMSGIYPKYFKDYNQSELHRKHNAIRIQSMLNHWQSEEYRQKTQEQMTLTISDECVSYIVEVIKNSNQFIGINQLAKMLKDDNQFLTLFKKQNQHFNKKLQNSINSTTLSKVIRRKINLSYFDWLISIKPEICDDKKYLKALAIYRGRTQKQLLNHTVVSITNLDETSDVYCMEVVGPNNEQDRHNFPVCGRNINGEYIRNGVFLSNCKYGDNFVYLKLDRERGIVGCTQLPNIEIERKEYHLDSIYRNITNEKQPGIQFNWKNKDLQFESWEIAHFRLVGDDRRLPYGTSVLEKARRIWKQLLLAEDAMLIYRTSRAPERRVFKVFVGNMDDDDVEAYVQKVANKFKRTVVVDPKTGQVDTRYNQLAVDQDFFIPVRDPSAPNPIDTLPGAQNLAEIADVEYIQRKLFAALRTPKAFLGFEDVAGDGKNLALKDIRFARTINRIQQSMIQELNKIAIIHLYVLGFEDEIDNFTLTLNNPSTQAELMKIEALKEKALLFKDLVSDAGNGFSITSMTWAKKNVWGFSEDEIRLDLEQQRLEKAAANELAKTTEVIIHTGIFDNIDRIFGKRVDQEGEAAATGPEGGAPGGGGGGLGGLGGGFGGDLGGGDLGGGEFPPPGEEGGAPGGEAPPPGEEGAVEEEGFIRKSDDRSLLIENRISLDLNEMLNSLDELINSDIDVDINEVIDDDNDEQ